MPCSSEGEATPVKIKENCSNLALDWSVASVSSNS